MTIQTALPTDLAELRRLRAKLKSDCAETDEKLHIIEAQVEALAIENVGGDIKRLGPNEAAQKRALLIAVEADPAFTNVRDAINRMERDLAAVEAEIEIADDGLRQQRRQQEAARLDYDERRLAYEIDRLEFERLQIRDAVPGF